MTDDVKADGAETLVLIALREPSRTGTVSLEETMARRRSVRAFGPEALSLAHIGQLAWSAQGVTDVATGCRTVPSAGRTLPAEVDLLVHGVPDLEDGVYRYQPAEHALWRRVVGDRRAAITDATLNQGAGVVVRVFVASGFDLWLAILAHGFIDTVGITLIAVGADEAVRRRLRGASE